MAHHWKGATIVCAAICLLGMSSPREGQTSSPQYPAMLAIENYLMDRDAEVALARSAAPASISQDATILVLGRHGYETARQGTNGFVCMVERGWVGALDWSERWNPKIRGADCLNPLAARSILPFAEMRTELVLAGRSLPEIVTRIGTAMRNREVPVLQAGAMSYMMGKGSYLTDAGGHNGPHLMFFVPETAAANWGAGATGSPVGSAPYWFRSDAADRHLADLPSINVFNVEVAKWSDGTIAAVHSR